MATAHSAIARKTRLAGSKRPVVLDGGPASLREDLGDAVGKPIGDRLDGSHDWILFFAADRAALESQLAAAAAALDRPGTLWIAYPKGSSKRQSDLTRDKGWDSLRDQDLMWLSLISIDDAWSAFCFGSTGPARRETFR